MENKTNNISHLVNDVVTPGEIADASWASSIDNLVEDLDEELLAWDEFSFNEDEDDSDEEETYEEYEEDDEEYDDSEYSSLYSGGYGFVSMHHRKGAINKTNFKYRKGDK